jgi:hypothetical protein
MIRRHSRNSPSIVAMMARHGFALASTGRRIVSFGSGGSLGDAFVGARVSAAEEIGDFPATMAVKVRRNDDNVLCANVEMRQVQC